MKSERFFVRGLAMALVMFGLALPLVSHAATPYAQSIIYLDAHDNIIGHQIRFCDNFSEHAGVIDQNNPYRLVEQATCYAIGNCLPDDPCDPIEPTDMSFTFFRSATGKTVDYYCNQSHPAGTAFYGAPACGLPAPHEMPILQPYEYGWQ